MLYIYTLLVILLYELGFGVKKTLKKLLPMYRIFRKTILRLTIKNYKDRDIEYTFPYDTIRIGRNKESNNIQIDHPSVSSNHIFAKVIGKEIEIKDLGSTYGTYYNGNRISSKIIPNNSTIRIGKIEITIFFRKEFF
jgi:pSer/pThr/pTyr-binding forkhead associated (FHA) protein